MKHDQTSFTAPQEGNSPICAAYGCDLADRVRRFVPMVRKLAWHVHGSGRPGIEVDDLMQAGMVALTESAQKHTGPGEDGFAAYAKLRVRGAMIDLIRRTLPISRGGAQLRKRLADKERQLAGRLGRAPTETELAIELDIPANELAQMRASSEPLRFEAIDDAYSDHDAAFADDAPDCHVLLENEEIREQLATSVAALPERLRLVVQLYFVEELNLSEIAEVLSVSIPRVHQIKAQALKFMREAMEIPVDIL